MAVASLLRRQDSRLKAIILVDVGIHMGFEENIDNFWVGIWMDHMDDMDDFGMFMEFGDF